MKPILSLLLGLTAISASAVNPIDSIIDIPPHTSSISAVRALMRAREPRLHFDGTLPTDSFPMWQQQMSEAMTRIMRHPEAPAAEPRLVKRVARDGYTLERWETYPLPDCVVPILVLVPDGVSAENPARGAALCIPGFGGTKEQLAGEAAGNYNLDEPRPDGAA
ncbi:MAG: alpha/beta hydrolase family protein, partial [Muribaculaceae bacterium]|nr:alpha/beta hydrolase family protein [Muribaculaceae bacterium]